MALSPERVTERVDELIAAIRHGTSDTFAERNAALTLDYIEQAHRLGIINAAQFQALVIAVNDAADAWKPTVDRNGLPWGGCGVAHNGISVK
jgi:hypothetical protein